MDAQAYLLRHGWTGPGNPLNPNRRPGAHGGLGLTKPILAARKQNTHGLGRKKTGDPANQWWLRGFDDALKSVGNAEDASGLGSRAPTALESELYRFFVRGEGLKGTLDEDQEENEIGKKRKRDGVTDDEVKRKEEKKRRKHEKREVIETKAKESKEERRARKHAKREKREKKEKKKSKKGNDPDDISKEKPSKAKLREKASPEDDYPTPEMTEPEQEDLAAQDESCESKDKRRKEKRESKKRKKSSRD